jgi:hypothetical protein
VVKERNIISDMPNKEPAIKRIRIFSEITVNGNKNMLMRITSFVVKKTLCLIKCLLNHRVIAFYIFPI